MISNAGDEFKVGNRPPGGWCGTGHSLSAIADLPPGGRHLPGLPQWTTCQRTVLFMLFTVHRLDVSSTLH